MSRILILNGPNLNMLGLREPGIYGHETLSDVETACRDLGADWGLDIDCAQYNSEGAMVDAIQNARGETDAIILNAGAYSHTSIAIRDALSLYDGLVIEVHISNIHAREPFRHHSHVSGRANGIIAGCGTHGYRLALIHVAHLLDRS